MIEKAKQGLQVFQSTTYKNKEPLFHELEQEQHPHTLFIACSDSRVSPELLLNAEPGDLFMVRNIANTVPAPAEETQDATTLASIEFAVNVLQVQEIIICGHSNCGGCRAALAGQETLTDMPYMKEYLEPLESVKEVVESRARGEKPEAKARMMEQQNVIEQVKHLKGYPFIQERMEKGQLEIEGWHYDIGAGKIAVYEEETGRFATLHSE